MSETRTPEQIRAAACARIVKNASLGVGVRLSAEETAAFARDSAIVLAAAMNGIAGYVRVKIIANGRKINQIKVIRSLTGLGLKESKNIADRDGVICVKLDTKAIQLIHDNRLGYEIC